MTAAEPLGLPEIDPEALPLLNDLAGTQRTLALQIGNEAFDVRFVPAPNSTTGLAASIHLGGLPAWLAFNNWSQFASVAELLDGEPLERIPAAIMPAVLNAAFENNLDHLAQLSGASCRVEAVSPVEQLPAGLHSIGVELASADGTTIPGCILAEADVLSLLRDAAMRVAPAAARSCSPWRMTAGVEIGLTQLAFDDLRSLKCGDVILFDVAAPRDKPTGLLRFAPSATWRASLNGGGATLLEPVTLTHWGRGAATGRTVALVFEQGRVELTAEQVASLQPGAELPVVDANAIAIQNGGRLVGTGELVAIGGRTGVRLDAWPKH